MRTCWKTLPPFRQIGDNLMKKYFRARPVSADPFSLASTELVSMKHPVKLQLLLRKSRGTQNRLPKRSDLVYLQNSPNYCEKDLAAGSLGTVGRSCNRTSRGKMYFTEKFNLNKIYLGEILKILFFTNIFFTRNRWLRLNVLWKRLQYPPIHEDLAMSLQIPLVLSC